MVTGLAELPLLRTYSVQSIKIYVVRGVKMFCILAMTLLQGYDDLRTSRHVRHAPGDLKNDVLRAVPLWARAITARPFRADSSACWESAERETPSACYNGSDQSEGGGEMLKNAVSLVHAAYSLSLSVSFRCFSVSLVHRDCSPMHSPSPPPPQPPCSTATHLGDISKNWQWTYMTRV